MKDRLRALVAGLTEYLGGEVRSRVYVDDGPVPDRAVVERSGVGWFGKNTNIIVPGYGSWVFLGEAIVDVGLEPDRPLEKRCGECTACLEACPTGAFVAPYVLDNRRCIAYLTIENRRVIPRDLRPLIGDRLFGCDTCQEVCPVNHRMRGVLPQSRKEEVSISGLVGVLEMQTDEFRQRFRDTAIWRAKLSGLQRNACVVMGNLRDASAVPALTRVLEEGEPLLRIHAAWALGRIGGCVARASLEKALCWEQDVAVLEEVRSALEEGA
jgi:epoxyqueuosine reductase